MKIQELQEAKLKAIHEQRDALSKQWNPFIVAVEKYLKESENRTLDAHDKRNIAQTLDNALLETGIRGNSKLFEATTQSNISFLGVQLPVIAALIPSLVLNQIAIVQALDRRTGSVFYLDAQYGNTKGEVASGGTLASAKTGHSATQSSREYARAVVYNEVAATSANGTDVTFTGTLGYKPVKAGSVIITTNETTPRATTDDGLGGVVTTAEYDTTGTINYTLGTFSIVFKAGHALANAKSILITYAYNYETEAANKGVSQLNINLTNEAITAEDFTLQAQFTMGAAIDLEKAHGIVLEDELVKFVGSEIKFELDHYGIQQIYNAAIGTGGALGTGGIGAFDTAPGTAREWIWHKFFFNDSLEKGNNAIFNATLRAQANFILAGNNVARLVKQLKPDFVPAPGLGTTAPTGPYVIGHLNGRLVVQDPFLPTNSYVMGWKGDNFLTAGFAFCPYIPLFATPTLTTSDLKNQKGFMSSAGYKVINAAMYTFGTVANLS